MKKSNLNNSQAGVKNKDITHSNFGCFSQDTEVLTASGYKLIKDITEHDKICIYNKDNNSYSYERPEKWISYKVENEDCYSIKSDDTDQIVSKNNRCLFERNGKLDFEFAENLGEKEIVPLFKENKFYNGDCLEVMKTLEDKSIDMVLTSPPYDNLRDYKGYTFKFEGIAKEIYRVLKDGGVCVQVVGDATINGSETGTSFKQALFFKELGLNLHDTMIWSKPTFTATGALKTRYAQTFEYMFVFSKGKIKTFNPIKDRINKSFGRDKKHGTVRQANGTTKPISNQNKIIPEFGQRFNVWEMPTEVSNLNRFHPAQFPEKLAEDHILSWSNEGDIIFDPLS